MNSPAFVCPKTLQPLHRVTTQMLARLNELCRKKRLKDHSGQIVEGPLSAIWLRSDREMFYPEREMIPVLLMNQSILVQDINDRDLRSQLFGT